MKKHVSKPRLSTGALAISLKLVCKQTLGAEYKLSQHNDAINVSGVYGIGQSRTSYPGWSKSWRDV
jgi:hypothetical protein